MRDFPAYDSPKNLRDMDFSFLVTKPVEPCDVELDNGDASFGFHKSVLRKISSTFRDILEGDQECGVIKVPDISSGALQLLQKIVYSKPSERTKLVDGNCLTVSGAGSKIVNGVYKRNGQRRGSKQFTKICDDRLFSIYRFGKCWYLAEIVKDTEKDFYRAKIDHENGQDNPFLLKWTVVMLSVVDPVPEIVANPRSSISIYQNASSIHSLIKKYDIAIMKMYILHRYQNEKTPNLQTFQEVTEDAMSKDLSELSQALVDTEAKQVTAEKIAEYPVWFITELTTKYKNKITDPKVAAAIARRAILKGDEEMRDNLSIIYESRNDAFKKSFGSFLLK